MLWPAFNIPAQDSPRLSLADALAEADQNAFVNRGAAAAAGIARATARLPLKGLLPSARVEAGAIRTTDPIGTFGTLLRQRRVTQDAFSPSSLNFPDATDNLQGAAIIEIPLLNSDALLGFRSASRAADAADARAGWTARSTRLSVVRAYYGAILSGEKLRAIGRAAEAGEAMTRQVSHLLEQGLVTRADLLQAQVHVNDVKVQMLAAGAAASAAREQLGLLLGRSQISGAPAAGDLPSALPSDSSVRRMAERSLRDAVGQTNPRARGNEQHTEREDITASRLEAAAASLDSRRALSTLLPRLNGIARYDWNSLSGLYSGRPNWTVGIIASWSLFGGGSELADVSGGRARLAAAHTVEAAALANAQLEMEAAIRQLRLALEQLDLAALSREQSDEAHRLVQRRYSGGLATMAELLGADAGATASMLAYASARYAVIEAVGRYRLSIGVDPGGISNQLDPSSGN